MHVDDLKIEKAQIEKQLGLCFVNPKLLFQAFIHRSFFNEHRRIVKEHNERLEFLGDAILGAVISDFLYKTLPEEDEGKLSALRASLVDASSCVKYLKILALEKYVLLGEGEKITDRGKKNILADVFEAIIGAIYVDQGYEKSKEFILSHFEKVFLQMLQEPMRNYKAQLQDLCQKKYQKLPHYQIVKETGPQHAKIFYVEVLLENKKIGKGKGKSKKEAEQKAAEEAITKWEIMP